MSHRLPALGLGGVLSTAEGVTTRVAAIESDTTRAVTAIEAITV